MSALPVVVNLNVLKTACRMLSRVLNRSPWIASTFSEWKKLSAHALS
jgi:hypothetical protein